MRSSVLIRLKYKFEFHFHILHTELFTHKLFYDPYDYVGNDTQIKVVGE